MSRLGHKSVHNCLAFLSNRGRWSCKAELLGRVESFTKVTKARHRCSMQSGWEEKKKKRSQASARCKHFVGRDC